MTEQEQLELAARELVEAFVRAVQMIDLTPEPAPPATEPADA